MTWLYLPSACSPYARASVDLISVSDSLPHALEPSATWKGKPLPLRSWSRVCRTVFWMTRLSGATLPPSTVTRGVARWISSWAASPARTSAMLAHGLASRANAPASGSKSFESFARWDRGTSTWRTSQLSLLGDSTPYSAAWPKQGSMRNGSVSRRRPWAPPTSATAGSASDAWPTPDASVANDGEAPASWLTRRRSLSAKHGNNGAGMPLTLASILWPTPTGNDHTGIEVRAPGKERAPNREGLQTIAGLWQTPAVSDATGGRASRSGARSEELLLQGQARAFPSSRLGLVTEPDGPTSSVIAPTSRRRLNPVFESWLMGFPPSWTEIDCTDWQRREMRSWLSRLAQHSSSWRAGLAAPANSD